MGETITQPTWFVATIWKEHCPMNMEQLRDWLISHHAKEGVIGEEVSPTSGKTHYQCKWHLSRGESLDGWKMLIGPMGHVEIAVEKKFTGYEEKDGKFVKWPESPLDKHKNLALNLWEVELAEALKNQDDRRILCVVDKQGGQGKSTFSKYLEANDIADICPVISDEYNDYTGYCMEFPKKAYVFDLPRATSIKRRTAMWSGIEQIKNGLLFEKRYKPRKMWIDPPGILVFTNDDIPWELLSEDRWDAYRLHDGTLYRLHKPSNDETIDGSKAAMPEECRLI